MLLEEFNYTLPSELIAQKPTDQRDASRLMLLNRISGSIEETSFSSVADRFRAGDLLVINDTRVIPARLAGTKETGGRAEVFLVRRLAGNAEAWQCLIKCSKAPHPGSTITMPEGITAHVIGREDADSWKVSFSPEAGFDDWLDRVGAIPLPPYIGRAAENGDRERYQTVFARVRGAVAAPTAGLHMTPELLDKLSGRNVTVAAITLHVGLGTFLPVRVENVLEHRMHREYVHIPESTAKAVEQTRNRGGRVIALGTTVCRALEYAAVEDGLVRAGEGEADIFIYPGYRFRIVDAIITNFHLPKSTLLMLVSAFAGKKFLFNAYAEAVKRRFRFFSYGDAMMIE